MILSQNKRFVPTVCRPRQQEVEYHSAPPAVGDSQRQGAEQAAQRSDHHPGWRLVQNPGGPFTQPD